MVRKKKKQSQTSFSSIPHQPQLTSLMGMFMIDRGTERKEKKKESRSVMSDSLWPHGYSPWNSLGQNTGVERVAFPFCRGSSQPRGWTQVSCALPAEPQGKPRGTEVKSNRFEIWTSTLEQTLCASAFLIAPLPRGRCVSRKQQQFHCVFMLRTWGWMVFVNKRGRAQGHMMEEMCMIRWLAWRGGCPFSELLWSVQEYYSNCPPLWVCSSSRVSSTPPVIRGPSLSKSEPTAWEGRCHIFWPRQAEEPQHMRNNDLI